MTLCLLLVLLDTESYIAKAGFLPPSPKCVGGKSMPEALVEVVLLLSWSDFSLWVGSLQAPDVYYVVSGKLNPTKQFLISKFSAFVCFFWIFYYNLIPFSHKCEASCCPQHLFSAYNNSLEHWEVSLWWTSGGNYWAYFNHWHIWAL